MLLNSGFLAKTTAKSSLVNGVKSALNKNSNSAVSDFALYAFTLKKNLLKIGKADASRITQKSGLPTRAHQQFRVLQEKYGKKNVTVTVKQLGKMTTKKAKDAERDALQKVFDKTGIVPKGNAKSFKPKTTGGS